MTAEKGSSGFILIDQLFREQRSRDEDEHRLAKANSLLKSINYLMYLYGPVKFSPKHAALDPFRRYSGVSFLRLNLDINTAI